MKSPPQRTFTPARIAALALVALVALGLGYLRFSPDAAPVSVPKGAQAGQLTLHDCTYGTEQGSYAADCGTLVVPENRAAAQSRLIALPVTRIRARSAHPREPVFRLEGGPGITNMKFAKASRFAGNRDVVLVGYRGVDGSVRLDCPEVESALRHSTDVLAKKSFRAYGDGFRSCARRLQDDGVDLAGYSQKEQADDVEAARKALGYGRVDLLSESAGTRLALIYAWRHPHSVHRSVMIGVNPPGHFLWDGKAVDEQLRRYSQLCAQDDTCSRRTGDLAATMERTADDLPGSFFGLPIRKGNVRVASFYGLMESGSESAPLSAPMTINSWTAADDGDASGFWFQSLLAQMAFPKSFVWGELAAVSRADAAVATRYFSSPGGHEGTIIGNPGADFIWGGGSLAEAWPATPDEAEYSRVRRSNVPTLMIGGELDFATPPQNATRELLPSLPNGRQVVLPAFGHTTTFWTQQPEAGTRLVNAYLDRGAVDRTLYEPQRVDFSPEVTQTALGKGFAAAMAGLALLTIISLLWLGGRVLRRGRIGSKSSIALRLLYPVVLGLGGWFLGVIVVSLTMPSVPLDDVRLAVLSIGGPIGLMLALAWVDHARTAGANTAGFLAATAGALAGAWLGFHAAEDLLAVITTIAGAAAGGNLALLLLDIARAARAREQAPAREVPAPDAPPVIG